MQRLRVLAACLTLAACASEASDEGDGSELSSDALVEGHGGITGPVKVEPRRLVIPREGNEALLGSAGRVLVGAPQRTVDNPYGFLRRAVSVEALDDRRLAITTEDAALGDAVVSGSVHVKHDLEPSAMRLAPMSNATSEARGAGLDISIGEKTLLDFHTTFHDPTGILPVRDFEVSQVVRLTHAQVRFQPSIDLALSIRAGKLKTLEATTRGALEASFAVTVDTKTSIDIDRNQAYRETLKGHLRTPAISATLFETKPYILPAQWIGFVPVIETVRFRVILECDVDLTSQTHADAGATVKTSAALGVRYRDNEWQPLEKPTFDGKSTFAMTQRGSLVGSCGLRTDVGFFLYDLAGPTLSITPYLDFDVRTSPRGYDFLATPGIRGAFGGRLQVLGWELLRQDVVLFNQKSSTPLTGSFQL